MRKNNYSVYAVLALALILLFTIPAKLQGVFRNQFLRPLIPFGHLMPIRVDKMMHHYPSKKVEIDVPSSTSYPGASLAKIIYRNPGTWNDFFWINLGSKSSHGPSKIVLNSPVLYDGSLIGLVDYVGKKQSRVQLITNSNLTVSVRALRGKDQHVDLIENLNALLSSHIVQDRVPLSLELAKLKDSLEHESQNWYLAKGELYGASLPLWRSKSHILLGRGFNCEFGDDKGIQRDLVTGKSLDHLETEVPILKVEDLLITTGLDGIFPEGLHVARVTAVDSLVEGAYSYSLEASPVIHNLNDLQFVEVILPIGFKEEKIQLRAFAN